MGRVGGWRPISSELDLAIREGREDSKADFDAFPLDSISAEEINNVIYDHDYAFIIN